MTTSALRGHRNEVIPIVACGMILLLIGCNGGDGGDGGGVSGNPNLTSLTLSAGSLVPPFDPDTTSYTVDTGFLITSTTVTVGPAEAGATASVNGLPLAAGVLTGPTDGPISLADGPNTLTILVTTPGGASKTYTITVTRDSAASFVQQAYLKASNTDGGDQFGFSVSLDGNTLVVGAPNESSAATGIGGAQADDSAGSAGAVYVFVRDGSAWTQQAYLKASNTDAGDNFGHSVSLDGETLAVGAPHEQSAATGVDGNEADNNVFDAGAAYVFVRNGTTWTQQAYLKASNTDVSDQFGSVVSLDGETLAVGAPAESSNATGVNGDQTDNSAGVAGAVYVFVRNGSTWAQQAYLKASNTDGGDNFGHSVALNGDTLAIGAHAEDSNATGVNGNQADNSAEYSGAVYVFVRSGTAWSQQAYLKASNTDAGDQFGSSVALSGDTLAVGAFLEDSSATGVSGSQSDNRANNSGSVYVFVRNGTSWSQQAYLKPSNTDVDDFFGAGVALEGNTLVVSSLFEDSNATGVNGDQANSAANDSGAVYVFVRSGSTWAQQAYVKASNTGGGSPGDQFGEWFALDRDTLAVGANLEGSGATGVNGNQNDNSAGAAGAVYIFR